MRNNVSPGVDEVPRSLPDWDVAVHALPCEPAPQLQPNVCGAERLSTVATPQIQYHAGGEAGQTAPADQALPKALCDEEAPLEGPREGERLDDLQNHGLRILQQRNGFRFGMDAVLLAHFARLHPRDRVADFGTGTGILPLLMSQCEPTATFHAFEIQPAMAEMARRSVRLNGLSGRIRVYAADMLNAASVLGYESMNGVVCNPPYAKNGAGIVSADRGLAAARHETQCTLQALLHAASAVLRNRGRLWMVLPAPRALELMDAMREAKLTPKRLRMVCAKASKPPYLLLLEAVKNARPGLHWLPPLMVYREDGQETDELRALYGQPKAADTP